MEVEFRIIDTSEMPPIVITQNENDGPKVVINTYHKLWISLNRRVIAGINRSTTRKDGYDSYWILERTV